MLRMWCILPSMFLGLVGCVSNYPTDLTLVSVQAVNNKDQRELDSSFQNELISSHNIIRHLIHLNNNDEKDTATEGDLDQIYAKMRDRKDEWELMPQWLLLKIEFQSKVDLHRYARENHYNLGVSFYLCDQRDDDATLIGSPTVFWRGFDLGKLFFVTIRRGNDAEPFTYYTFLHAVWGTRPRMLVPGGPEVSVPYDLRITPEDICLEVRGGAFGSGYRSNVVIVPRKAIAIALKTLPPPFDTGTLPEVPGSASTTEH